MNNQRSRLLNRTAAPSSPQTAAIEQQQLVDLTRQLAITFLDLDDLTTRRLAVASVVTAYFDRPRLVLVSSMTTVNGQTAAPDFSIDIWRDTIQAIAAPGQSTNGVFGFNFWRGITETVTEDQIIKQFAAANGITGPIDNAAEVFAAAAAQSIPVIAISGANASILDGMSISAEAKARVSSAIEQGEIVLIPSRAVDLGGVTAISWYEINPATGEAIGVTEDGGHQAIVQYAFTLAVFGFIDGFIFATGPLQGKPGTAKDIKNKIQAFLTGNADNLVLDFLSLGLLLAAELGFYAGYRVMLLVNGIDDDASGSLMNLQVPLVQPQNSSTAQMQAPAAIAPGAVSGTTNAVATGVSGDQSASWTSSSTSAFQAQTLTAAGAVVEDSNGKKIGSGSVALSATRAVAAAIAGNNQYSVNGTGSLSFYGPAESSLRVSGDWQNYTATVSGNVAITITTGSLTLNGTTLPAGTYTITTSAATLTGSGASTSPDFAGSVSITASGGTVDLGAGAGNLSVGGKPLDPAHGVTMTGYTGTVSISANGDGTDAVTLSGNAGSVLAVAPSAPIQTIDQNTPTTIATDLQTSLAGTYTLAAQAPPGWTVSIDTSANVTVQPAPGLQSGIYPIQIIASVAGQSQPRRPDDRQRDGHAHAAGHYAVSVASDSLFTVPFDGAEVPTAFRATIQNLGPAADTYNLSFSNVTGGFMVVDSGAGRDGSGRRDGDRGHLLATKHRPAAPAAGHAALIHSHRDQRLAAVNEPVANRDVHSAGDRCRHGGVKPQGREHDPRRGDHRHPHAHQRGQRAGERHADVDSAIGTDLERVDPRILGSRPVHDRDDHCHARCLDAAE